MTEKPRTRIILRKGMSYVPASIVDVAFCVTENKVTFVQLFSGERLRAEYSLSECMLILGHTKFFRVNRQMIINVASIKEYRSIAFNKMVIDLIGVHPAYATIEVSQVTSPAFRQWMEGI